MNAGSDNHLYKNSKLGSLIWKNEINEQKSKEIDDIIPFLQLKYYKKKIIYFPNPGNGGDRLIVLGTLEVFKQAKLDWEFYDNKKVYENSIFFYAGGGNLIGEYHDCKEFINKYKNNKNNNEIVILPHTIKDEDWLISSLGKNVTFFCREKISFEYVKKLSNHKENVYLSKDLAFYISNDILNKYKSLGKGECNLFRTDKESTDITIPQDNIDLSNHVLPEGPKRWSCDEPKDIEEVSNKLFDYISNFEVVNTNRLHLAIAGCLIGKKVNFYCNNYYKNKAVYEYSIKNKFPNVKFE